MKRMYWFMVWVVLGTTTMMAQQPDPISIGLGGVAAVIGETRSPEVLQDSAIAQAPKDSVAVADTATAQVALKPVPTWKKKLYYGYNFDIYYHNDTRNSVRENGWSIALEPEIGWKLKERFYLGMRLGGSYQETYASYTATLDDGSTKAENLRVRQGSWSVTPYVRYRLKSMFDDKLGIWLEAHLYTGMEFPSVVANSGDPTGTDYDGLRHSVIYGAQVSPVITYRFNRKSTFQIFFSILSLGYSGTAFFYEEADGSRNTQYTNDVIIFSGKLRNLLANQFTPGLYGLKFGVQKNF
ncbi:MAG: hypothetical protein IJS82_03505 [Paludibacteraceae bacterium]|nr:hypothetical protein [Paludibacteraceae bacterium]